MVHLNVDQNSLTGKGLPKKIPNPSPKCIVIGTLPSALGSATNLKDFLLASNDLIGVYDNIDVSKLC